MSKLFEFEDIGLTEKQIAILTERIELVMRKYEDFYENSAENNRHRKYWYGVADGLNHASKIINSIEDDYLTKPKNYA